MKEKKMMSIAFYFSVVFKVALVDNLLSFSDLQRDSKKMD
jgi:hypothetical protein